MYRVTNSHDHLSVLGGCCRLTAKLEKYIFVDQAFVLL